MRSYQSFVLSLSLTAQVSFSPALAQEKAPQVEGPGESGVPILTAPLNSEVPVPTPAPTSGVGGVPANAVPPKTQTNPASKAIPGKAVGKPALGRGVKKVKKKAGADPFRAKQGTSELDTAIVGEAQVLPQNVLKARYVLRSVTGEKGYDSAGKEQDLGASLAAVGHALVVEYGVTDRWVLQLIAPYTSSNELVINASQFKQSQVYEKQYAKFVDEVAPTLINNGLCSDLTSCRSAIDKGLALATATPVELPSGEVATVGANVPIRDAINSIILKSIEPQSGKTGLGDLQVGLGYNVFNSPLNVLTIGLGMRFPSGLFSKVADAYRAPGSGFMTTGLLIRYDLRLTPVVLSFSHQAEYSLNKAKRTRSSLLSPGFLNGVDPTTDNPEIPGAGDGIANDMMIERKGLYHVGYTRLAYALGQITPYAKPFAVYAYYGYAIDPEYHNNSHRYRKKEELYTASIAFSVDGLAMNPVIPASITYRREIAIGGRNAFLAPDSNFLQFSAYYKF